MKDQYKQLMDIKTNLLVHGCNIDESVECPELALEKQTLLYTHSSEKTKKRLPDDIILGRGECEVVSRIRFNPESPYCITSYQGKIVLFDQQKQLHHDVGFIPAPKSSGIEVNGTPLHSMCSFLGKDLLGIIPSNYCFYFGQKAQCKFCEIWGTFKDEMDYRRSFKKVGLIKQCLQTVLENDPNFRHIAITTGNIKTYDYSVEYYGLIGQALQEIEQFHSCEDVLATLMPPEKFELMKVMKDGGFNKIYYPLEVFNREQFAITCPGKNNYGYDRMLDALSYAVDLFGKGNVYTNFVYGIQSLDENLNPNSYDPERENELSLIATDKMLNLGVIPAFTLYHYGGYNQIGSIPLDSQATNFFFKELGSRICAARVVPSCKDTVIFSRGSLTNTLYNEGFFLSKLNQEELSPCMTAR